MSQNKNEHIASCNNTGAILDHLGNHYQTVQEMCAAYEVSFKDFKTQLNRGYSKEEALTGILKNTDKRFTEETMIAEKYGLIYGAFLFKIRKASNKKQALNLDYKIGKIDDPAYDYTGREFQTAAEMCKLYGIGYSALSRRLKEGCSIEKALKMPYGSYKTDFKIGKCFYKPIDHFGRHYHTIQDMCWEYGISALSVIWGEVKGYDLQAILEKRCVPNFWPLRKNRVLVHNRFKRTPALFYRAARFDWDKKKVLLGYRLLASVAHEDN